MTQEVYPSHTDQNQFTQAIREKLQNQIFEVVEVIPIPSGSSPNRLKVLQEIMMRLGDAAGGWDSEEFLIRVQKKNTNRSDSSLKSSSSFLENKKVALGEIYLPNRKLNIPYLIKNADLLLGVQDYVSARKIYYTILQSGEFTVTVLQRLGLCYEGEGKLERAYQVYEESVAYQPTVEAYQRMAAILVSQNKAQEASLLIEKALRLEDPKAVS